MRDKDAQLMMEALKENTPIIKEADELPVGYIQIDFGTGSVRTISPDEVNSAIQQILDDYPLAKVGPESGDSDWDAWKGEEYMIVAIPKTVHWQQPGGDDAYGRSDNELPFSR